MLTMYDYLLKIKNCVDKLASVGHIMSVNDHIEAIFNRLTNEYDAFVVFVSSRTDSYFIQEIESLLLAQEARIEKNRKDLDSSSHVNLAIYNQSFNKQNQEGQNFSS